MNIVIIPEDEAQAIKALPKRGGPGREPSALSVAILRGEMVFVVNRPNGSAPRSAVRVAGFTQLTRKAERNGVKGYYVWAVPR